MAENLFQDTKFSLLGGRIIAGVLIQRLLETGNVKPESILATDVNPDRLAELQRRFGVRVTQGNRDGAAFGDIVFIAVPPRAVRKLLMEVREVISTGTVIVSLAAAIPVVLIEEVLGKPIAVVRVIPNTPSLIGRGMNPHCVGKHVSAGQIALVESLLALFGETIRIEETLMNAATALTAVGPAYVFPMVKALKEAAIRLGLPEQEAQAAAPQTLADLEYAPNTAPVWDPRDKPGSANRLLLPLPPLAALRANSSKSGSTCTCCTVRYGARHSPRCRERCSRTATAWRG